MRKIELFFGFGWKSCERGEIEGGDRDFLKEKIIRRYSMKFSDLTEEQKRQMADNCPEWIVQNGWPTIVQNGLSRMDGRQLSRMDG